MTEAAAKEAVSIFVQIPSPYIGRVELVVNIVINQISATSKICIPEGTAFTSVAAAGLSMMISKPVLLAGC